MKKFLVLYKASADDFQNAMKATPEQQKAGMNDWMAWSAKAKSSIVDLGAPLGPTLKVTESGGAPSKNDLGGFSIMQGESQEAVATHLKGHPHFKMGKSATIEVVELMSIPGM